MKKLGKILVSATLLVGGIINSANAQSVDDGKKDNFFKRAFRDMKESAKLQRQIDKANYQATKLETKAFYQEQKRKSNPSSTVPALPLHLARISFTRASSKICLTLSLPSSLLAVNHLPW